MTLQLYRRHRKEYEGGHREDSKSGQFEEGRRGWKHCACLIHVSGSIIGKFGRRSTGERKWDEAHAVVLGCLTAGFWPCDSSRPRRSRPCPDALLLPGPQSAKRLRRTWPNVRPWSRCCAMASTMRSRHPPIHLFHPCWSICAALSSRRLPQEQRQRIEDSAGSPRLAQYGLSGVAESGNRPRLKGFPPFGRAVR
jgi:hypothetical protein